MKPGTRLAAVEWTAAQAGQGLLDALAATAAAMRGAAGRWWLRARAGRLEAITRHELHALSDRRLRDIGLHRDQIDTLFR